MFKIDSGRLLIIDPLTPDNEIIIPVKNGEWEYDYEGSDNIESLLIKHKNFDIKHETSIHEMVTSESLWYLLYDYDRYQVEKKDDHFVNNCTDHVINFFSHGISIELFFDTGVMTGYKVDNDYVALRLTASNNCGINDDEDLYEDDCDDYDDNLCEYCGEIECDCFDD